MKKDWKTISMMKCNLVIVKTSLVIKQKNFTGKQGMYHKLPRKH